MRPSVILILSACSRLVWMRFGSTTPHGYPENCTCDAERMRCENVIPRTVPNYTSEIILSLSNSTLLSPGVFCNVSWNDVTRLTIKDTGSDTFSLNNYVFICLKQIQVLKLHLMNKLNVNNNVLYGLDNVKVLDLSECDRLWSQDLVLLLSGKTNVANLTKLILSNTGILAQGIDFSQDLVDALSDKDIAEVDLSNTPVLVNDPILDGICDSLKTLNLSSARINNKSHFLFNRTCRSFRNLDLNEITFPRNIPHNLSCVNTVLTINRWFLGGYHFFQSLSMLNLSRVTFNTHLIYLYNCSIVWLQPVSLNLIELRFSGHNILAFDVRNFKYMDQLQFLDFSDNRMESIGSHSLEGFQHLMKIDLSKNKLSQTHLFDETFSVLFRNNSLLEEISLKDNGLRYLPSTTFSFNIYLKRIDISSNRIKEITFNVSRLIYLDFLDMRNNSIQHLDEPSRLALDFLYERHQRRKNHSKQVKAPTVLIDLRLNPFTCECDSVQFLKWFVGSPIFTATRHQYRCKANGQEIEMNNKAIEAAEDDCERPKRKLRKLLLSSVIPTLTASLLVLVIVYVVKRYRKKKFHQRFEDQVGLLHDNEIRFRFPIFLSYSSDDSEFVMSCVLNPLKDHLQRIAGTDRDLVCVGDRYFRPGRSIFSEIITCLQDCAVVVVVMSQNYCKSDYCKLEIEQSRLMRKPIIIIVKEEVEEKEMNAVTKEVFRHFTRIGFIMEDGQAKLQHDWEDVCVSIIQLL